MIFPEEELRSKLEDALAQATKKGVDAADASLSMESGFAVSARKGDVEKVEHHQERGMSITVFRDQRTGSASTSDLSTSAIAATVEKACAIAKYSGQDPCNGLADQELMAHNYPDVQLYHPWEITPAQAIEMAIECETTAREHDPRIQDSGSADVDSYDFLRVYGNTHGFIGAYPSSIHSVSCSVVIADEHEMQRDFEYSNSRRPDALVSPSLVALQAAEKATRRLGARKISTRQCPVIFHSRVAKGLLGCLTSAISGGNLYRDASFLCNQLNQQIFPDFIHIHQAPHMLGAMGSTPFDGEGSATHDRDFIRDGVLQSYILGSYSARKLGMQSTGNAGGVYNLLINHSDKNLEALLKDMGTGLLVTELMGQGIRILTGDYSRGAAGFWVEDGEIQFPVAEITIAGNLKDMFKNIVAVGNDVDHRGNVQTGSIFIESMVIAGS